MQVVWTKKAVLHLAAIRSFIEQDKPEAARRIAGRIILASENLAAHPGLGRPGRKAGTRELVIPNTPFILPYRIRSKSLAILAVLHGARKR